MAGAIYVVSLFFLVTAWWYPSLNLERLAHRLQPVLPYVAVAVVALSYIFGFVAHRLIQIANLVAGTFEPIRDFFQSERWNFVSADLEDRMRQEATILGLSPERIHREIDFQFAQVALLRSLLVSVPFLVFSIDFWCLRTGHHAVANDPVFAFWVFLLLAYRRQSIQYEKIRGNAVTGASRSAGNLIPSLSPASGPAGTLVTIKGINFGTTKETCTVTTGTEDVQLEVWEPTRIVVRVPGSEPAENTNKRKVVITVQVPDTETGEKFTLQYTCPLFTLTDLPPSKHQQMA